MRENLLVIGILASAAASASASQLIYEPFDYTVGQTIVGQVNPSTGNTWFDLNTTSNPSSHAVNSGNLPSPFTGLPSQGNSADLINGSYLANKNENVNAKLDFSGGAQYDTANTTLYYSVLLQISDLTGLTVANSNAQANNDGIVMFGVLDGTAGGDADTNWAGELVIRKGSTAGTYNLGIRASSTNKVTGATAGWTGDLTPDNTTQLVVVRYVEGADTTTNTDDENDMWLDPASSTFGVAEGSVPTPGYSAPGNQNIDSTGFYLNGIVIGAGIAKGTTPNNMYIDELRVGTTWADVAPKLLLGDTDGNGVIDSNDLTVLETHYGQTVAGGYSVGDFNGDGVVNTDDFALFQLGLAQYNESLVNTVPEPASASLLSAGIIALLGNRRRRK